MDIYPLSYSLVNFICWTPSIFFKSPCWPVWTFWERSYVKQYNLCVIERSSIDKVLLFLAISVNECLWSRLLEISPKSSKIVAMRTNFSEKSCSQKNLTINDQILDLWSEFCELSLFSGKIKIRSSYSNFPEQTLTSAETHFISIHISLSLFQFSLKRVTGSEYKRLNCHLRLAEFVCNAKSFATVFILLFFFFFYLDSVFGQTCKSSFTYVLETVSDTSTRKTSLYTSENDCSKKLTKSKISMVRAWHVMCFRANNNGEVKLVYTVKDIFWM